MTDDVVHLPPPPRLTTGWTLLSWTLEPDCCLLTAAYDKRGRHIAVARWALSHATGAWSCQEGWSSDGEEVSDDPPLRAGRRA